MAQLSGLDRAHQTQQRAEGIAVAAAQLHLRHQRHPGRLERFGQEQHDGLHQLLVGALALHCLRLGVDGRRLGLADRADGRRAARALHLLLELFALRQRLDFLAALTLAEPWFSLIEIYTSDPVSSFCLAARCSASFSSRSLSAAICFCANVSTCSRAIWRSRSWPMMFSILVSPACGFGVPIKTSWNSSE